MFFQGIRQFVHTIIANIRYAPVVANTNPRYTPDAQPDAGAFRIWFVIYLRIWFAILCSIGQTYTQQYWTSILVSHETWLRTYASQDFTLADSALKQAVMVSTNLSPTCSSYRLCGRYHMSTQYIHTAWIQVASLLASEVQRRAEQIELEVKVEPDLTLQKLPPEDNIVMRWVRWFVAKRYEGTTMLPDTFSNTVPSEPPTLLDLLLTTTN